jgi:hypothetical protein
VRTAGIAIIAVHLAASASAPTQGRYVSKRLHQKRRLPRADAKGRAGRVAQVFLQDNRRAAADQATLGPVVGTRGRAW